jgi:hypothetical protein
LIDALSKVENQHFDTLLSLINGLKLKPEAALAAITDAPDNPVNYSNKPVTDSEIDELTNKMLPLVAKEGAQPVDVKAKGRHITSASSWRMASARWRGSACSATCTQYIALRSQTLSTSDATHAIPVQV